jgi:hypothetical protein
MCVLVLKCRGIARLGPMSNVCFSLKCRYGTWLGPRSNVCFSLECRYCKVGSHVQCVFQFWNASIARLGSMFNACFNFGMQVVQG